MLSPENTPLKQRCEAAKKYVAAAEPEHRIGISHEFYTKMEKIRKERRLDSVGAAIEQHVAALEEKK